MNRRILLSAIILVTLTVQICIFLLNIMPLHHYPKAKQGILNLSERDLSSNRSIPLRGEWIYYPEQLTTHDDNQKKMFVNVPTTNQFFSDQKTKKNNGTYHLKMILPNIEEAEVFAFKFASTFSANTIYLNNKMFDEHGKMKGKEDNAPLRNKLNHVYIQHFERELDLFIQVSNHDAAANGFFKTIWFGKAEDIEKYHFHSSLIEFSTIILFFIFGIVYLFFYPTAKEGRHLASEITRTGRQTRMIENTQLSAKLFNRTASKKEGIYLLNFCFATIIYIAMQGDKLIYTIFPSIPYTWTLKWMYLSNLAAKLSLFHFVVKKYLKYISFTGLIYLVNMIFFLFAFIFLCADFPLIMKALLFWLPFIFMIEIFLLRILWKTTIKHPKENAPLIDFIFITCYIGASITNLFYMTNVLEINNAWIVQLLVLIVAIIAIMLERFFSLFRHLVTANKKLFNENKSKDGNIIIHQTADKDSVHISFIIHKELLTKTKQQNQNLSLKIAKQLIELHGIELIMQSNDRLFTIQFSLPLAHRFTYELIAPSACEVAASKTPSERIKSVLPQKQENTILIVEEDEAFREKLVNLLTAQFTKVIAVSDGKEILPLLTKQKQWDFILLDIHLLSENSLTICKKLREVYSMFELPIMMMSNKQTPEQTNAAFAAGVNDMILKSIDMNELKSRIQMLLYLKKSVEDKIHMEITFLQAQVRPHFLFNTLNAIAALSEEDNDKMKELLIHFGYYLQESFSFDNIKPLSSLKREIKLVDAYLNIEKVRFQDRLEYELMIPDNLSLAIPPLTIQPLVENAVHHGILKKREGGKIWIRVLEKQNELHVCVEDNGVGMSDKTIADILNHKNRNGVGVKNIHHRLKQMFGQGLLINSQELTGTKIFFSIPREEILDDCFDC